MNMKKVLVINGSRNYVSKGYKIISKIQKGLDSNKFEMVLFDPNKLQLEFCRGCKNCFNTGKCPLDLKDSGKLLKDSMIEADFIIFLSPVYAHNVSGDIKNIIDRLSYWLHLFPLLGKPGIIVTTTDTNGHKPVEEYLEHTVCLWGIDIILKENFYNTYSQQNIESRIEKIVNVINQMNFSKMPHFTSYQEAAFQNYKFAFSLNKETEEHRYWEENGLFCADSMEELYKLRIMQSECGLACATMILNYEGINISLNEIRDTFGVPRGGISLYHLIQVMTAYGIKCKAYEILDIYSLRTISTPFICLWEKNIMLQWRI